MFRLRMFAVNRGGEVSMDPSRLQVSIEFLCLSITVVQFLFTTLNKKCNRLKARVVIYAYNHHVRLLSPEPAVVDKPQSTRVKEPTLLCNHVDYVRLPHDPVTRDSRL